MIKINQLKLPVGHSQKDLEDKIRKTLRIPSKETFHYEVMRRSLDARKKRSLFYVYCIYVTIRQENSIVKKLHQPSVSLVTETGYRFSEMGQERLNRRPVIVGAGPCGLFAAWQLTLAGYAPLILERGKQVEDRSADVERFWKTGILQPDSNVQFGEGGAGTFSDGKLNTVVKDPSGRNRYVLETFVKFGAPSDILYDAKPHIGTDILAKVIKNMRDYLIKHGAEFRFQTCLKDIQIKENALHALVTEDDTVIPADVAILALGHSARDTFMMLHRHQLPMEAKNFAVGFRVEHPQQMINDAMYGNGKRNALRLPAAPYKVTSNFPNGRGVYSFCMCPGGYVVNASSMKEKTCVNGMSYSGRSGKNANSAIIVSVSPADYGAQDPLDGMHFQETLEHKTYQLGNGKIPQQLFGDYRQNIASQGYGDFNSQTKGQTCFANLRGLMTEDMEHSFLLGMEHFSNIIPQFDRSDAILSGMETRTSSPVRIMRDTNGESRVHGIYPGGEGAGYAGGIMSAAMDGLRLADDVMKRYHPVY